MIRGSLGMLFKVIVELCELQVDNGLFRISADESASQAFYRIPQPRTMRRNRHGIVER